MSNASSGKGACMDTRESMVYFAHGLKLEIALTGDAKADTLADSVDETTRYHGFRPRESDNVPTDLEIAIHVGPVTETVPKDAELLRTHTTGVRMLQTSEHLYLARDSAIMRVQAESGHASIFIPPGAAQEASDVNSTLYLLLTFGLVLLLQTRDLFVLHGRA